MTIDEFNRMMEENSKKIADYVILPTAVELVNLVRHRVQQTGKKSSGGSFSAYSQAYAKKRRDVTSFKNFTDTGAMWDSFGVKEIDNTIGQSVIIAKMDDDPRNKTTNQGLVEIHSDNEDSELIAPSEEEINKVKVSMNKRLQELWA